MVVMEGMFLINSKPWIGHKNLGNMQTFCSNSIFIHIFGVDLMKYTYCLTTHIVRLRVPNSLKGSIEMRAIQCLKVTNAGNFPQIWGSHPSGGKMSLTVGTAKGALSVSSPIIF